MRKTLAQMITPTITHGHDPAKQHLRPAHHREHLPHQPMHNHDDSSAPKPTLTAKHTSHPPALILQMQLQPRAQPNLRNQHQHDDVREVRVHVRARELAALVHVAQEVGWDEDDGRDDLGRDVPFATDYAEDHAKWEEQAE